MAELEAIHKELDLIQDVIKRMADNSFKVKAWMMSIYGAVLALTKSGLILGSSVGSSTIPMYFISIFLAITVIMFWYLDAFFLRIERLYRQLYKWVVKYRPKTDKYLYDLNTFVREVEGDRVNLLDNVDGIFKVMLSKTLRYFYSIPLILSLILLFVDIFS